MVADLPSEASARVVAGRLEAEGITTFVYVEPQLAPYQYTGPAHVMVRAEDEAAARAILDELTP